MLKLATICLALVGADGKPVVAVENPPRPTSAGQLELRLRSRLKPAPGSAQFQQVERAVRWEVSQTAIIVCDMWDDHYCKLAAQRVGVMVPRMNEVLSAARSHGVFVLHAPSGTMDVYANAPQRRRMILAPNATPPFPLENWCHRDKTREPELPVDVSDGPCDDPVTGPAVRVFSRQHPGLLIGGYDGISDSGKEIYNLFIDQKIKNVAIMGVHTNMCVLGRPFGIRQLVRLGFNVALVRDLTDAMYDPRDPPYVSHARGTEMVIEHVESHWCPSVSSSCFERLATATEPVPTSQGE